MSDYGEEGEDEHGEDGCCAHEHEPASKKPKTE